MLKLQYFCIWTVLLLCSLNAFVWANGEFNQPIYYTRALSTPTSPSNTTAFKFKVAAHPICRRCKCNIEPQLQQLDCRNLKKISIFIESEWNTLLNGDVIFEQILLQNNSIKQIPRLPAYDVKYIDFSHNQIEYISKGAFQSLRQLQTLDLSHNQLKSAALFPDVFRGQYSPDSYEPLNIKELNLGYNMLHNLDADLFEHLPKLENLILRNNVFRMMDYSSSIAIGGLRSLKTLDLSYMELDELPKNMLHGPDQLENLILSGNVLESIPEALASARALQSLILDENPIGDLKADNIFVKLENLSYLSISYMPELYAVGPYAFGSLKSLSTLVMVSNPHLHLIDKLAMAINSSNPLILNYAPLRRLYLHNNNLSNLHQNFVPNWHLMETIDLRFNPWACDRTNFYIIEFLMLQINNTTPLLTKDVRCATPAAWKNELLLDINGQKQDLACETYSSPEKNSFISIGMLVAMLVGVLLGISLTIVSQVICRRRSRISFDLQNREQQGATPLFNPANFAKGFYA